MEPDRVAPDVLIGKIKDGDMEAKLAAVAESPKAGPAALVPLSEVLSGSDPIATRAAQESIRRIAYEAGRSKDESKAAAQHLASLISKDRPRNVRVEALRMLGIVGGGESVKAIAAQLSDPDIRDDARMALERIPDRAAEKALADSLRTVAADYRPAIEQSLRHKRLRLREIGIIT